MLSSQPEGINKKETIPKSALTQLACERKKQICEHPSCDVPFRHKELKHLHRLNNTVSVRTIYTKKPTETHLKCCTVQSFKTTVGMLLFCFSLNISETHYHTKLDAYIWSIENRNGDLECTKTSLYIYDINVTISTLNESTKMIMAIRGSCTICLLWGFPHEMLIATHMFWNNIADLLDLDQFTSHQ